MCVCVGMIGPLYTHDGRMTRHYCGLYTEMVPTLLGKFPMVRKIQNIIEKVIAKEEDHPSQ